MGKMSKQNVIETLKTRILQLDLEPGALLDESSLSAQFGISRTPMREIFQTLSGSGYLTIERNRGAKVASMDFSTMRHFFQAAPMIYASISRLAAEQANVAQIKELKEIQRKFRASIKGGRVPETAMHNHRFHEFIGQMANSPYLTPSLNRLLIDHTRIGQLFYRSTTSDDEKRIGEAADHHDTMIEAFANHRAAEAVKLTLDHWELSRRMMEKFVSPDPLPFTMEDESVAV